ncbi:MAG: DUF2339 domain-containing protein, partial [Phycisphaerae bacterium]|nr:DUF2339 domain-containing protein [Phycisphaerae bacterium]
MTAETDVAPAAKPPEKIPTATPIATLLTGQPGATLERAIGEKWMAWVGAVAILVGGGLFLKYAFEQGWLSETARVVIMFIVGAAFLVVGEYFQRRRWGPIAQVATGIGIAMEYFAAFASSHNFYALVSQPVSFGFMIIVTAMAIGLAVRYNAITIAVIAFLGGLFTPVMLRTGEDQQVKLMTYILLLDVGVLVLAYFKKWRWLNLLVFLGTVGLFFLWMAEHYSPVKMDRTLGFLTAFFVLFSATTIVYHFLGKIRAREDDIVLVVLNAMWALFTAYGLLENHQVKLMTYVLLLDVGVLALAYFKKWRWLNIVMFLGTVCVFFMWMVKHYDSNRLGPTLAFLAGFFALFSATTIVYHFLSKIRDREDDLIMLFLNGAWAFFTAYGLLYDDYHIFVGPMAVVLGAAYLGMALMVRKINANQRHLALTMIAMALGFLTIAIPIHLEGHWITISWAVEAAVLLAIGIAIRDLKIRIASFVVYMLMAGCLIYYVEDVGRVMDNLLLNKRCLTFGVCIASLIVSYRMLQRSKGVGKDEQLVASTIFGVVAHVFALWLLTMET